MREKKRGSAMKQAKRKLFYEKLYLLDRAIQRKTLMAMWKRLVFIVENMKERELVKELDRAKKAKIYRLEFPKIEY